MGKNAGKRIALGTLIAGVTGYLAGLLTAPKSGKATRKDIKDTATNTTAEIEKQLKNLHKEIDELLGNTKKSGQVLQSKVAAQAKTAKETVRTVLSSLHEGVPNDKELKKALKEANDAITHLKKYAEQHAKNVKKAVKK